MEKTVIPSKIPVVPDSNRYKTTKGEVSLIEPCMISMNMYEIYCISGNLFEDIERFDT